RESLVEIKQYQGFPFIKKILLSLYDSFASKQALLFKKSWQYLTLVGILPSIAIFLFLLSIASKLSSQTITPGTFVFLFTNIFIFFGALEQLTNSLGMLITDAPFIHDAIEFYQVKPSITFPKVNHQKEIELLKKLQKPEITFQDVSFAYPNSQINALNHINLTIPYGQNLALNGKNGAGKTTLVKLLLRIYDPTEGKILINGHNLKTIPESVLFSLYSTLFQNFGKFYLTIKENMDLAAGQSLPDSDYEKALKLSNAWNFIKDFPKGINQQLGANYTDGTDLSGGQWQLLAIARALVRQTPVLILDEPTSSIDAKSETEIFDRLNKETKNKTLIFISHRFSTIKDAQRIIVLDQGKVIEEGNHNSLMKANTKYAKLYRLQAERYERDASKENS
ncbi:MAG: ABC transporter ATP-binding protein, partial [Patescibacteria group bacterium]